jgi:predicted alpha/beta-hydrolase family hydrolase
VSFPVDTPHGTAEVRLDLPDGAPALVLVLGHGAGGSVEAPDLVAVREAALGVGAAVASVTQPYRVAGRRAPAPAGQLDTAWVATVSAVRRRPGLADVPLLVGGRSSGARVACRTAAAVGASGIVALAFPLHPPGKPERSRAPELETGLPTLVVNGDRDPFGVPDPADGRTVHVVPGADHALRRDVAAVAGAVTVWLGAHRWAATPPPLPRLSSD